MHVVRLHEFGPAEQLRFEPQPAPTPGPGQVRVAVEAAGVHLIDTALRAGQQLGPMPLPTLPTVPGREFAGVVDQVGDGTDEAWLGRRVVAHLGPGGGGAYAEQVVCDVDRLHVLPDHLDAGTAVAMIGTGRTAVAITELAAPTPDDVVLVTGAAGGLGTLLLQAARAAGAVTVGAAAGQAKVDHVRALGTDLAVDYDHRGWEADVRDHLDGRDVTLVLDGVGGAYGRTALELLGTGGRLVLFGWSAGAPTTLDAWDVIRRGLTVTAALGPRIAARPGGVRSLEELALAEAAAGRLVPTLHPFPLDRAADAHAAIESRRAVGKVVLVTDAASRPR